MKKECLFILPLFLLTSSSLPDRTSILDYKTAGFDYYINPVVKGEDIVMDWVINTEIIPIFRVTLQVYSDASESSVVYEKVDTYDYRNESRGPKYLKSIYPSRHNQKDLACFRFYLVSLNERNPSLNGQRYISNHFELKAGKVYSLENIVDGKLYDTKREELRHKVNSNVIGSSKYKFSISSLGNKTDSRCLNLSNVFLYYQNPVFNDEPISGSSTFIIRNNLDDFSIGSKVGSGSRLRRVIKLEMYYINKIDGYLKYGFKTKEPYYFDKKTLKMSYSKNSIYSNETRDILFPFDYGKDKDPYEVEMRFVSLSPYSDSFIYKTKLNFEDKINFGPCQTSSYCVVLG